MGRKKVYLPFCTKKTANPHYYLELSSLKVKAIQNVCVNTYHMVDSHRNPLRLHQVPFRHCHCHHRRRRLHSPYSQDSVHLLFIYFIFCINQKISFDFVSNFDLCIKIFVYFILRQEIFTIKLTICSIAVHWITFWIAIWWRVTLIFWIAIWISVSVSIFISVSISIPIAYKSFIKTIHAHMCHSN